MVTTVTAIYLLITGFGTLWIWALLLVSLFRLFNLARILVSKIQPEHLRRVAIKTARRLWLLQFAIVFIGFLLTGFNSLNAGRWTILAFIQLVIALLLVSSTKRHQRVAERIKLNTEIVDRDAPTLTVAIPARNETESLNECLRSVLNNNYPKLEVLVLDDQSTIRRTPEIIRSFAHDGVEFVAGKPVPQGWVAKNWAYQQLLEASNGEIVLFCGADTRFESDALRFLVSSLDVRGKKVISILPRNSMPDGIIAKFIQPLRYAWEVSLPRRSFNRPPVLSTCWAAEKKFMVKAGGFKGVARRVVPESYFAKQALNHDGYSFFMYDGVTSEKAETDKLETAIRTRYPQLHRQPELAALLTLIELFLVIGSLPLFIWGLIELSVTVIVFSGLAMVIFGYLFALISAMTYRQKISESGWLWPIALALDIWLVNLSMWRYEFGTVLWKGRSVSPSVMNHQTRPTSL